MENQVEEIKQKLNIVDIINRYVPLIKKGKHHSACCPFHQEKSPSFTVSEDLQIYKCFGCGKSGDIFNFVQEYERVEFKEALEILAKAAGITLKKSDNFSKEESRSKLLIQINTEASKFYNYILTSHPVGKVALDYILNRGVTLDTINTFKIGYSPQDPQLITTYLRKKGFKDEDLVATGSFGFNQYGQNRLYDRFNDRLIFPLSDYRDRILGFSGRILPSSKNPNLAKYINSPETEIYHKSHMLFGLNITKESIRKQNSVIVTEGEFDMISPFQIGIDNIVALKGTAFTYDQLQLLKRYADTLILALDSDFAGNNAARKSIELAESLDFDIQVLELGQDYKDPDEAVKGDPELFKAQVKKTIPVWDFIIQSTLHAHDISNIKGKKDALEIILPFINKIKNSVIRNDYYSKLAQEIGSTFESVRDEARKYDIVQSAHLVNVKKVEVETPKTRLDKLYDYLLLLILGSRRPEVLINKMSKFFEYCTNHQILEVIKVLSSQENFNASIIQDSLAAENRPFFQNLYLNATQTELNSEDRLVEIKKIAIEIQIINLKEKININSQLMAQLEAKGENTDSLDEETNQLFNQLSKLQTKKP